MGSLATFEVGNYEIFRKRIGKGAFSTVYKGYNKVTNELVAVKEISLDTLNKYEKSIKRETEIMKKLNHPYIIKLYDTIIDETTENVYLVMEYFEKGDLAKYLNKRPLKEKYALKYLKQISEAIKYLLDSNILHRDLKPNNILMTDCGNITITDFGFARYFDNELLLQTICGSPLYMAPEIIKNKKYDYKSDLWSIGIIFYEMLIGCPPFKAKNIYELIRKIENDKILIPKKFKLSEECHDLLFGLLQKDPKKRINYDDFFNNILLSKVDPFEEENKLMEISNLSSFPKIPSKKNKFNFNLNNLIKKKNNSSPSPLSKSESFYNNSINHNSKNNNSINNNSINNNSINHNSINHNSINHNSINNNSINNNSIKNSFNNSLDENKIITSNMDSSFYNNKENTNDDTNYDLNLEFNFNLQESSNINISNNLTNMIESNNSDYLDIKIEEDYFRSSMNINDDSLTDYVIISSNKYNRINADYSNNYITKSLYFLKESYKFFSNYNSI